MNGSEHIWKSNDLPPLEKEERQEWIQSLKESLHSGILFLEGFLNAAMHETDEEEVERLADNCLSILCRVINALEAVPHANDRNEALEDIDIKAQLETLITGIEKARLVAFKTAKITEALLATSQSRPAYPRSERIMEHERMFLELAKGSLLRAKFYVGVSKKTT